MFKKRLIHMKAIRYVSAAIMIGVLVGTSVKPANAVNVNSEHVSLEEEKMILDSIRIDEPKRLEEIELPECEFGTLKWVDPEYVPTEKEEDCQVILEPDEEKDLSWMKGWNPDIEKVIAYITIQIGAEEDSEAEENTAEEDAVEADTNEEAVIEEVPMEEAPMEEVPTEEAVTEETPIEETRIEETITEETVNGEPAVDETPTEETPTEETPMVETPQETPAENVQDPENEDPNQQMTDWTEEDVSAIAAVNHECSGITVTGENLPWYVEFRVNNGDAYQFSNKDGAEVFLAYEFELWNTQTDEEYIIPEGEYITIRMNVTPGYQYTVEHLLPNGAKESIIPIMDGEVLTFSTGTLSPFGIAGSTVVVGGDGVEQNYTTTTPTPTAAPAEITTLPTATPAPQVTQGGNGNNNQNQTNVQNQNGTHTDPVVSQNRPGAVNTGDNSRIMLFAGIAVISLLLIVTLVIYLIMKKR